MSVKITDLGPVTLPIVATWQLEVAINNVESRRLAVGDLLAAVGGLDATFVTVTANPDLPNERILTAGSNIDIADGGAGLPITIDLPAAITGVSVNGVTLSDAGVATNFLDETGNYSPAGGGAVDRLTVGGFDRVVALAGNIAAVRGDANLDNDNKQIQLQFADGTTRARFGYPFPNGNLNIQNLVDGQPLQVRLTDAGSTLRIMMQLHPAEFQQRWATFFDAVTGVESASIGEFGSAGIGSSVRVRNGTGVLVPGGYNVTFVYALAGAYTFELTRGGGLIQGTDGAAQTYTCPVDGDIPIGQWWDLENPSGGVINIGPAATITFRHYQQDGTINTIANPTTIALPVGFKGRITKVGITEFHLDELAGNTGGGGGGAPGGADTNVQFNNAGAFGGVSELTFVQGAGAVLQVSQSVPQFRLDNTNDFADAQLYMESPTAGFGISALGGFSGGDVTLFQTDGAQTDEGNFIAMRRDSGVELYFNDILRLQTISDGVDIVKDDSTDVGNNILRFEHADGTSRILVGSVGSTFDLRSLIDGGLVLIRANDAGGTLRTILQADPDNITLLRGDTELRLQVGGGGDLALTALDGGATSLFFNAASKLQTELIGVNVTGHYYSRAGGGSVYLSEKAGAAVDEAGLGQHWVRTETPNLPMFTDDGGTDQIMDPSQSEINVQNGNYTAVLADKGKTISKESGGGGETFTIPSNAAVAYKIGTYLGFNNDGGGNVSIAITTDTLIFADDNTTGTRTLADGGMAVAQKVAATTWKIAGANLS